MLAMYMVLILDFLEDWGEKIDTVIAIKVFAVWKKINTNDRF